MSICEDCKTRVAKVISCTVNSKGEHHSLNGDPAIVLGTGNHNEWRINGILHRVGGPALVIAPGKGWFQLGICHRLDGPAIEWENGEREWYLNGDSAAPIYKQEIIIGKSITIKDDVGTVLRHVEGVFYEVLLGNKKMLIAKA